MREWFFFLTYFFSLVINYSSCQNNKAIKSYDPTNYSYNDSYSLMPIPADVSYTSNNTCVTFPDLVQYNYTDYFTKWSNWLNVYPENYCYSMLTYNISREDFFDIVNKNLRMIFFIFSRGFLQL